MPRTETLQMKEKVPFTGFICSFLYIGFQAPHFCPLHLEAVFLNLITAIIYGLVEGCEVPLRRATLSMASYEYAYWQKKYSKGFAPKSAVSAYKRYV